jgi:hypothetical protein
MKTAASARTCKPPTKPLTDQYVSKYTPDRGRLSTPATPGVSRERPVWKAKKR